MARNPRNQKPANVASGDPAERGWLQPDKARFINVYLNAVDNEWLQAELPNHLDIVAELFTEASKHSARVSVVPDARSGRYNATFTSFDSESPRYGFILSVRGATPLMALYCLAYANGYKVDAWSVKADDNQGLFG